MRIAFLSNVTTALFANLSDRRHVLWQPAGFGRLIDECLAPSAGFREFAPEVIFVPLDGRELMRATRGDVREGAPALAALCERFPRALVLASDVDVAVESLRPRAAPSPARAFEAAWRDALDELAATYSNFCPFELKALVEERGRAAFYDARLWYAAAVPFSLAGHRAILARLEEYLAAYAEPRRKVLAVDLDNTLWKGVVGEVGAAGVALAPDREGAPYSDFQGVLKELRSLGVALVCLSKNNPRDVEAMWRDPRMTLREEDFTACAIGWEEKALNLRAVAERLNLGLEAFVFVDDNPAERAAMRAFCPEVAVPEFPADTARLPAFARELAARYFATLRMTDEDRAKTDLYRAEARRREFAAAAPSPEAYLQGLEIRVRVRPLAAEDVARVAQLSLKSNQFNVLTHRLTEGDVRGVLADPKARLFTVHAHDRFGDQGLVAFVRVSLDGAVARIEDWVMSCRAMGRTIEQAAENAVERELLRAGITHLEAAYAPTARNAPVADLFERLGFATESVAADGAKRYSLALPGPARVTAARLVSD